MIKLIEETSSQLNTKEQTNFLKSTLSNLINHAWEYIEEINGVETTLDQPDFESQSQKENIQEILKNISDDIIINIGMLYNAINLISPKTAELIKDGQEKANELLIDN